MYLVNGDRAGLLLLWEGHALPLCLHAAAAAAAAIAAAAAVAAAAAIAAAAAREIYTSTFSPYYYIVTN